MRLHVFATLVLCFLATSAAAQPGATTADRSACVAARRAELRAAQTVVDVVERTRRLQALPDCGPAPAALETLSPWEDVSHINGRPVRVGERHAYLKRLPARVILATNPLAMLVGFFGLSASVAISDHVAIRGNVEHFDYELFGRTTGYELALSAPIYLQRTFSGPFIEPGFLYQETMDTPWLFWGDEDPTPVAHTWAGPELLFGWQWTFDSGFSVAAAFGGTKQLASRMTTPEAAAELPRLTGYLRLGIGF